jgi:hypothetical protein
MTGEWIAKVASVVIRQHTYDLTVEPAIADLQREAASATGQGWSPGYLAVWRAVFGAIAIDLAGDFALAFSRDARSTAWHVAANVFGGLFLLSLLAESRLVFAVGDLGIDGIATVFALRLPSIAASCLPALLIPIAVVLTRRLGHALRPILLSAVVVSSVFAAVSVAVVVPASRTADQYRQAAYWRARMDTTDPPRSLGAIRQELTVPLTRPDQRRARADNNRYLSHDILARSAGTFAFALIGLGFARKRGWRAFAWYATAFAAWSLLMWMSILAYERAFFPDRPAGLIPWTRTGAMFLVGTLALLAAGRDARRA